MKVVLFCGGQGMRIRDHDDAVPKPMVQIGNRPILWHLMKYYAYFGHKEFILCLGYKAEVIKDYFLNYKEWVSNDFVLSDGGRDIRLAELGHRRLAHHLRRHRDAVDDRRTADGGRPYLAGEEMFLANYADGLTDLWLPDQLDAFQASGAIGIFMVVHSPQSFHMARVDDDGTVHRDRAAGRLGDLVQRRLLRVPPRRSSTTSIPATSSWSSRSSDSSPSASCMAYRYQGFWQAMDTFKDQQALEARHQQGEAPWQVWRRPPERRPRRGLSAHADHRRRGAWRSRVLCLGAHSDDIEIGCGGTLLKLLALQPAWRSTGSCSAPTASANERGARQRRALPRPDRTAPDGRVIPGALPPYDPAVKEFFDQLGREPTPDLVLCPWQGDAHQDHRLVAELAANTFRDQLILEYEIPKYDGDLGRPSVYVHLPTAQAEAKIAMLTRASRASESGRGSARRHSVA